MSECPTLAAFAAELSRWLDPFGLAPLGLEARMAGTLDPAKEEARATALTLGMANAVLPAALNGAVLGLADLEAATTLAEADAACRALLANPEARPPLVEMVDKTAVKIGTDAVVLTIDAIGFVLAGAEPGDFRQAAQNVARAMAAAYWRAGNPAVLVAIAAVIDRAFNA